MLTPQEHGYSDALDLLGMSHDKLAAPNLGLLRRGMGMLKNVGGKAKPRGGLSGRPSPLGASGQKLAPGTAGAPTQVMSPKIDGMAAMGAPKAPAATTQSTLQSLDKRMSTPPPVPGAKPSIPADKGWAQKDLGLSTSQTTSAPPKASAKTKSTDPVSLSDASTMTQQATPAKPAVQKAPDAAEERSGLLSGKLMRYGLPAAAVGGGMYMMNQGQEANQPQMEHYYGGGPVNPYAY